MEGVDNLITRLVLILFAIICFEARADLAILNPIRYSTGDKVDALNDVPIFYNGLVNHSEGRSLSQDGYNLGLKYQCVEFVKRYYFSYLKHRFPDSYGHAKDFFDSKIKDGERNISRALAQFSNPSISKPQVNDIIVFAPSTFNEFGHVAIISSVNEVEIEIAQQNPGPIWGSRERISISKIDGLWRVKHARALGWLRK